MEEEGLYVKFGGCFLKYILLLFFFPLAHGCVYACHSVRVKVEVEAGESGGSEDSSLHLPCGSWACLKLVHSGKHYTIELPLWLFST